MFKRIPYLVASTIRKTFAEFDEVFHHFGRHVRPQLKHYPERWLVVNLDLNNLSE
jgi:hypothetical protein